VPLCPTIASPTINPMLPATPALFDPPPHGPSFKLPSQSDVLWARKGAVWHAFPLAPRDGVPGAAEKSACHRLTYTEAVAVAYAGMTVEGAVCGPCRSEWIMGGRS